MCIFLVWKKHFSYRAEGLLLHLPQCHLHLGFSGTLVSREVLGWACAVYKLGKALSSTVGPLGLHISPSPSSHPNQQFAIEISKKQHLSYCCLYVLIWSKTWKKAWWVYRCAWGLLAAAMKWQMERSACSGQSSSHGFLWLSFRKGKTLLVAPVYLNHLVATKDYT